MDTYPLRIFFYSMMIDYRQFNHHDNHSWCLRHSHRVNQQDSPRCNLHDNQVHNLRVNQRDSPRCNPHDNQVHNLRVNQLDNQLEGPAENQPVNLLLNRRDSQSHVPPRRLLHSLRGKSVCLIDFMPLFLF